MKEATVKGLIFDVKRFAVHDGPGIRTTIFFKGCPLRCAWCHNPEGIGRRPELMLTRSRCAGDCRACVEAVSKGVISRIDGSIEIDRTRDESRAWARAADACLYDALRLVGRRVSVGELVAEVEKDRAFYERSGGGVSLSGGEPLLQHEFLSELVDAMKARGLRTALDTSGHAPWEVLERIARKVDIVLYDLKLMDDAKHKEYTGVSNARILDNLRKLATLGREISVRIPLIPGVNDDAANIRRTAEFVKTLRTLGKVSVLPYHKGGKAKAEGLGKGAGYREFSAPDAARAMSVVSSLEAYGLPAGIGA
jgi:pyruvate formate lyase activating enzyme